MIYKALKKSQVVVWGRISEASNRIIIDTWGPWFPGMRWGPPQWIPGVRGVPERLVKSDPKLVVPNCDILQ